MDEGKKVRLPAWLSGVFIEKQREQIRWKAGAIYHPATEDILADDWQVVEEPDPWETEVYNVVNRWNATIHSRIVEEIVQALKAKFGKEER